MRGEEGQLNNTNRSHELSTKKRNCIVTHFSLWNHQDKAKHEAKSHTFLAKRNIIKVSRVYGIGHGWHWELKTFVTPEFGRSADLWWHMWEGVGTGCFSLP